MLNAKFSSINLIIINISTTYIFFQLNLNYEGLNISNNGHFKRIKLLKG